MADATRISLSVVTNADATTNLIFPYTDTVETTHATGTHSHCATATFTSKKPIR